MKKIVALAMLALIIWSCENDDADRRNRYFTDVDIVAVPALNYDSDGSAPDLRVDLKRRSTDFWEFSTTARTNADRFPTNLAFRSEILATDEWYEIRLVDEDPGELQDDEVFFWEFQAMETGEDQRLSFYDNGQVVLELYYINR